MSEQRILVAGIGNIFHGDDAFGVVVASRLMQCPMPEGVRVLDFGIRSYDLAFAITEGYDAVILVDACERGYEPGTVFLLDPELDSVEAGRTLGGGHGMNPEAVLSLLEVFGGYEGRLYVVGCEPETLESDSGEIGLSVIVERSVGEAMSIISDLIESLRRAAGESCSSGKALTC